MQRALSLIAIREYGKSAGSGSISIGRTIAFSNLREETENRLSQRPSAPRGGFAKEVSSMTGDPVSPQAHMRTDAARASSGLTRCAVGVAAVVAVVLALTGAIIITAFSSGGSDAISDNWIGLLGAIALIGGLIASFVAFLLAITAKIKREQSAWLWLPLLAFPAMLLFLLLGEVLWWE